MELVNAPEDYFQLDSPRDETELVARLCSFGKFVGRAASRETGGVNGTKVPDITGYNITKARCKNAILA